MGIKIKTRNVIECGDWDELVVNTYGRPYKFQQQDGCQSRGNVHLIIPSADNDGEMYDKIPEIINGEIMGIKFAKWIERDPKAPLNPILSGGQLQRVALARNLVTHEKIMLLDEPHGALDMKTKLEMDDLLSSIWYKIMDQDPTFLLVTHDVNEAVYLANEIIIMGANPGRIVERINIDLGSDRNSKIKRTKEFIDYTSYIEDKMLSLKTN